MIQKIKSSKKADGSLWGFVLAAVFVALLILIGLLIAINYVQKPLGAQVKKCYDEGFLFNLKRCTDDQIGGSGGGKPSDQPSSDTGPTDIVENGAVQKSEGGKEVVVQTGEMGPSKYTISAVKEGDLVKFSLKDGVKKKEVETFKIAIKQIRCFNNAPTICIQPVSATDKTVEFITFKPTSEISLQSGGYGYMQCGDSGVYLIKANNVAGKFNFDLSRVTPDAWRSQTNCFDGTLKKMFFTKAGETLSCKGSGPDAPSLALECASLAQGMAGVSPSIKLSCQGQEIDYGGASEGSWNDDATGQPQKSSAGITDK